MKNIKERKNKMLSSKYSNAAVEILDILNHVEKDYYNKIPTEFINMLEKSSSKTYISNLDYSKRLIEMDLSEETKALLGVIYRNYWCPEEKKAEFENKILENERKLQETLREKYNPNNMFPSKSLPSTPNTQEKTSDTNSQDINLVKFKENFFFKFKKILKKISTILKKDI